MSAAALVADLLERTAMSKSALARAAGISRSSLDEWLKGERQPSIAQLERLGEAAGLRLDLAWHEAEHDAAPRRPRHARWGERTVIEPRRSLEEKARILEVVTAMAMELPSKERSALRYPSLRTITRP